MTRLRLLFVKQSQSWPRSSGHDVHGYHMMKALAARGHDVSLATILPPTAQALDGLMLEGVHQLAISRDAKSAERSAPLRRLRVAAKLYWTPWQRRFTNYFGVKDEWAAGLAAVLHENRFDGVIAVARHLLPLLSVVKQAVRVWYPADEPVLHHLSRIKVGNRSSWGEAGNAIVNGLYERSFRSCFDRVWVVSPADRRAMRLMTGCRRVDLIQNGVDAEYYRPGAEAAIPTSCVFWGRLDFGPNVDALAWFLRRIWPIVKAGHPTASFHVFGFNPAAAVRELVQAPGVELHPDLPDLRSEVTRRQVVVLPFISGGGIKNKLLEAAALGMPIVCTRKALAGMKGQPVVRVAQVPRDWATALGELWANPTAKNEMGKAARDWVIVNHTWAAAARAAETGILNSIGTAR